MAQKFYSVDDAFNKLNNTICLWKGEPYHITVSGAVADNIVHATSIRDDVNDTIHVDYTSEDFSYDVFELGYMRIKSSAYYLTRIPRRAHNEGLRASCISPNVLGDRDLRTTAFYNCVMGNHPSLHEALSLLNGDKCISVPISRYVAVSYYDKYNSKLLYKGQEIGVIINNQPVLYKTPHPTIEAMLRHQLKL